MNERSIKTESASGLASRIMRVALAKSRLKRSGRVRSLSSLLGVGACLGLCSASTFASPGDLDQTFGNLGSVHLPLVIGQYSGILTKASSCARALPCLSSQFCTLAVHHRTYSRSTLPGRSIGPSAITASSPRRFLARRRNRRRVSTSRLCPSSKTSQSLLGFGTGCATVLLA